MGVMITKVNDCGSSPQSEQLDHGSLRDRLVIGNASIQSVSPIDAESSPQFLVFTAENKKGRDSYPYSPSVRDNDKHNEGAIVFGASREREW
jgi:hypothetical protein